MCIALAIAGAAVVGAGATAYAGSEASSATKDATNAQIGQEKSALSQQEQLEAPYNKIGTDATTQYENLLGTGPNSNAQTISEALKNTPGYQFTQAQGETGILNAASASGGVSGNTLTALDTYNTGLADNTYEQALNNSLNAVNLGQAAASGTAANIGQATSGINSALAAQGANTANIDIGTAAGISKALGGATNNAIQAQTLQALNGAPAVATPAATPAAPLSSTGWDGSGMVIDDQSYASAGWD